MPGPDTWMRDMFNSVSGRYVFLNLVLTFGGDRRWRRAALKEIRPEDKNTLLDVCTGTGDLALRAAGKFPGLAVYGLDYSPNMLAAARESAKKSGLNNLTLKEEDCRDLKFASGFFDYVTVSFGFRNLSFSRETLDRALKQVYRVLKTGGRFIILETSRPGSRPVRILFDFYVSKAVPALGRVFTGNRMPYGYLGSSIVKFYDGPGLVALLESYGFRKIKTVPFLFGGILLSVFEKPQTGFARYNTI